MQAEKLKNQILVRFQSLYFSDSFVLPIHLIIIPSELTTSLGEAPSSEMGKLKWVNCSTKIWGIYFSYDEKGQKANNDLNFNLKLQRLQSNLDIWCSRDLTLFSKVLIIKTMGISSLVYSAANIDVPSEVINVIKSKIFRFLWKNKRDKI